MLGGRRLSFVLGGFAERFRGGEAWFAVGQVAAGFVTEFAERGVRQANNVGGTIHKKLGIDGVRVACGNAVPHMREAALIGLPGQFGSDFEGADELAHGAGIGEYWAGCHARSLADYSS